MKITEQIRQLFLLLIIAIALISCDSSKISRLSGAGATFPSSFYNVVFKTFSQQTETYITYGAIGSGGGIRSLLDQTVDFGATDVYLSDKELSKMPADIVHIPAALGAVVISYNLPIKEDLQLNAKLISAIFRGKITHWNDSQIEAINPDITLPDLPITVVYRSDGSGTTAVFSDYLSKTDSDWEREIGKGKLLNFPVGVAGKGNPNVAGIVVQTQGAIGYIGSEYALVLKLPAAKIENSSGNYVKAEIATISAAANIELPDDTRGVITNAPNPEAYPISTITWIIAYKEQNYNGRSRTRAEALVRLLDFVTNPEGQEIAAKTFYAPISGSTLEKTKHQIRSITYNGEPLLQSIKKEELERSIP